MKKFFKALSAVFTVFAVIIMSMCTAMYTAVPQEITVSTDSEAAFSNPALSLRYTDARVSSDLSSSASANAEVMLFGSIPVKSVDVTFSERQTVNLGGQPFGIRLYTDGLVVAQTSTVPTTDGMRDPAAQAGIECGDIITEVNGEKLKTNEQLMNIVENSDSESIRIKALHNGKPYTTTIIPVTDTQLKRRRLGLWVRDSCAGIGTITFTDKTSGTFAGLGHGIYDNESGSLMPLSNGDIVPADIISVNKSSGGSPGSLCGFFSSSSSAGTLTANDECGIYGKLTGEFGSSEIIEIAYRQEAVRGNAQIRTTINGSTPEYFDIEIEDISYNNENITKNMIIKITDERLLSETGGIVQGMSGSPIIQNGRLVGAVTHVFINDPSHGYAIFAENMAAYNNSIVQKSVDLAF